MVDISLAITDDVLDECGFLTAVWRCLMKPVRRLRALWLKPGMELTLIGWAQQLTTAQLPCFLVTTVCIPGFLFDQYSSALNTCWCFPNWTCFYQLFLIYSFLKVVIVTFLWHTYFTQVKLLRRGDKNVQSKVIYRIEGDSNKFIVKPWPQTLSPKTLKPTYTKIPIYSFQ